MTITYVYPPQAVSVSFPAGAATEAKQDAQIVQEAAINTKLALLAKLTDTQPVSGPLTDAQLRAASVPVSGTFWQVTQPVSGTFFQATQPISAASLPLPSGASTEATLLAQATLVGAVTETAPATDTASSGLNGRLQRIAQRITSLIALIPASLGQKTMANGFAVTIASDQSAIPVTVSGVATAANQSSELTLIGAVTETAPASDTASSGLNGRLQRIAQRITSLIALVPASLGQKTMTASFAVTLASDQGVIAVNDSTSVAGTVTSIQATVGTSAVRATVAGTAPNAARKKLMVKPSKNNSGAIYIGASTVTTANGMEIIGPDRLEFEFDSGDYYLISDTAAQVVEIVEKV